MKFRPNRRFFFGVAAFFTFIILIGLIFWRVAPEKAHFWPTPSRFKRPDGMAPPAFRAFVRACVGAKIHPRRITQTIGDHPLSVGYHFQDGVWPAGDEKVPYCAATDVEISDLPDTQIQKFLEELARQGFAAFYRHGGKWRYGPHIHAIYAQIPMKWQLRNQVSEWANERRKNGKTAFRWERKWP